MNQKKILILAISIALITIGITVGIILSKPNHSDEEKSSSAKTSSTYLASTTPIIIAVALMLQPTTPVNNAIPILANKKYTRDKKINYLDYYVTCDFKASDKYSQMLDSTWEKLLSSKVKEKGQEKNIVTAELKNGEQYEFEVIKRTKENSPRSTITWVINDYKRI